MSNVSAGAQAAVQHRGTGALETTFIGKSTGLLKGAAKTKIASAFFDELEKISLTLGFTRKLLKSPYPVARAAGRLSRRVLTSAASPAGQSVTRAVGSAVDTGAAFGPAVALKQVAGQVGADAVRSPGGQRVVRRLRGGNPNRPIPTGNATSTIVGGLASLF
jgi:hypothetical protein